LRAVLTQNLIVDLLQTLEQRSSCAGDEHWHSLLQPTTLAVSVLLSSMTSQIHETHIFSHALCPKFHSQQGAPK